MSRVVHVVARATADDPHTLGVVALAAATSGSVYAAAGPDVDGVGPLAELHDEHAFLVYHQRGAAPALVTRLATHSERRSGRLAVVHDDAPPDPLARRDLQMLAAAGALGVATSTDGEARLHSLGFERTVRVAPVVASARLAAVEAFEPTTHHLDVALHGPLVLTVDDVVTATNASRVVQAYHVLRTYLVRSGHLAIAVPGVPETSEAAVWRVCREVWGLRLTDAWAHRLVGAGERAALVRHAAVFVSAGSATGDVAQALAAMAEGVPVVALADASAAEVLGAGAVLLSPNASAALVAEAVADVLDDESRRAALTAAAAHVIARYAPEAVAPGWLAALAA